MQKPPLSGSCYETIKEKMQEWKIFSQTMQEERSVHRYMDERAQKKSLFRANRIKMEENLRERKVTLPKGRKNYKIGMDFSE